MTVVALVFAIVAGVAFAALIVRNELDVWRRAHDVPFRYGTNDPRRDQTETR